MIVPRSHEPIEIPGSRVKVALGPGNPARLGPIACGCGVPAGRKVLLVSDRGVVAAGHAERAIDSLSNVGIGAELFSDLDTSPTTFNVDEGTAFARGRGIELIVGLGGGSAMDCAKGINFILTNGGWMQDYEGVGWARNDLLPMIAIPTTAGTGSEAQSFALITEEPTYRKMACGDARALPLVAILDAELTASAPPRTAAAAGIDAVAHAVETSATKRRNDTSRAFSLAAWALLNSSFQKAMTERGDLATREAMLLGAHLAGAAIENSMLGAAHSLANALTEEMDGAMAHGEAVGLVLPHVVRFNAAAGENPYSDLEADAENLARRIEVLLAAGGLPERLDVFRGIAKKRIPQLAKIAAHQWTAAFNPRLVGEEQMREIFEAAL